MFPAPTVGFVRERKTAASITPKRKTGKELASWGSPACCLRGGGIIRFISRFSARFRWLLGIVPCAVNVDLERMLDRVAHGGKTKAALRDVASSRLAHLALDTGEGGALRGLGLWRTASVPAR